MKIFNFLLALLGLVVLASANPGGSDKKCSPGHTFCTTQGSDRVYVCKDGKNQQMANCDNGYYCENKPEAYCAKTCVNGSCPSAKCRSCELAVSNCMKNCHWFGGDCWDNCTGFVCANGDTACQVGGECASFMGCN